MYDHTNLKAMRWMECKVHLNGLQATHPRQKIDVSTALDVAWPMASYVLCERMLERYRVTIERRAGSSGSPAPGGQGSK